MEVGSETTTTSRSGVGALQPLGDGQGRIGGVLHAEDKLDPAGVCLGAEACEIFVHLRLVASALA